MNDLKTVSALVKQILEDDVDARNSDNVLYLEVLRYYASKKGIDLCQLSVPDFLMNMEQKGLPAFETVRRSRQKVQATYPDLAATGVVGAFRARNEKVYVKGSLKVFNHRTNVDIQNRLVCYDIKELGNQLKKIGMLVVQDQVWGRVTQNRNAGKSTRYYIDEFHLLLKEEQTATYSIEIWKRFRKWGGIPTGITQNVKDLLRSPEIANILENSDFIYMLNQASEDRTILAQRLNISPHQLSYVTNSGEGEGLLFYGNVILPFVDRFPKDIELYRIMTTKLSEVSKEKEG